MSRGAALACVLTALCACRAPEPRDIPAPEAALRETLDELYRAFCFDPGAEPDWAAQRAIFLEEAVCVSPIRTAEPARVLGVEAFLAEFRAFATQGEFAAQGLHERILEARVGMFGGIAHAFVLFEGFHPASGAVQTRGVDSLQFVLEAGTWRLVSFTTQYEGADVRLPRSL